MDRTTKKTPPAQRRRIREQLEQGGFDITCTIGHVSFTHDGGEDPKTVAFRMIAEHGAEGTFSFPAEDGGMLHVTVEHEAWTPDGEPMDPSR